MILNDQNIRKYLIKRLKKQSPQPNAILEELRVHNGSAVADVVTIHKGMHCYEIKGYSDVVNRIKLQGNFYNLSFQKITLVTTENHIKTAMKNAPAHWGIILAYSSAEEIKFKYIKKSKTNKNYNKKIALLTLWKNELLNTLSKYECKDNKKLSRESLCTKIASYDKKTRIDQIISEALIIRQKTKDPDFTIKVI